MSYSKNKNGNKYRFSVSSNSKNNRRKSFKVSATPTREQWAEQVVRHFLNVNVHLSSTDTINEWSDWAKEDSKRWSDDGNTITPWRFIAIETDNMIPFNDRVSCEYWSDDDAEVSVNAQGYYKPDVAGDNGQERIDNPRRMWGNNCPYIDKLIHRLLGNEKYTEYEDQYSYYDYVEDNTDPNFGKYIPLNDPDTGQIEVIMTASEVQHYYWDTFGYNGGVGDNTSNWLYPLWGGKDGISSHYGTFTLQTNRKTARDTEGKYFDREIDHSEFTDQRGSRDAAYFLNVDRLKDIYFYPSTTTQTNAPYDRHKFNPRYYYKSDAMCIFSSVNAGEYSIVIGRDDMSPVNSVLSWFYTKNYNSVRVNFYYNYYNLPSLRGNFNLMINDFLYPSSYFNTQQQVPLSRANIHFGSGIFNNLSKDFKEITTNIAYGFYSKTLDSYDRGSRTPVFDYLNIEGNEKIVMLNAIRTNGIRIFGCSLLRNIEVHRRVANTDTNPFLLDIDANDTAININIPYVTRFELCNCNLTTQQVDAVLKAFKEATQNGLYNNIEGGTGPFVIRLDDVSSSTSLDPIKNDPPSATGQSYIDYLTNNTERNWSIFTQ